MLQTSVRLRAHRCVDTSQPGSSDGRCPKIAGGIRLRATLARPATETTKLRLSTLHIRSGEPRVKKSPQALAPGHEGQKKHGWDGRKGEAGLRGDMPAMPSLGRLSSSAQRPGSLLRPPYSPARRGDYVPRRHRPRLAVCCRPRSRVATPAWTPSSFSGFAFSGRDALRQRWAFACGVVWI
jgi:hypothetical protein